jgi:hypothetical protein
MAHKAVLGSTFLGLAAIVGGAGTIYGRPDFLMHAAFLALVGTTLAGAGMAKSDQFYRDRSAVLETGVDRRAGRIAIPPTDLKKLEAKADPSKGDK